MLDPPLLRVIFLLFSFVTCIIDVSSAHSNGFQFAANSNDVIGDNQNRNFTCDGKDYGYYADQGLECKVFHICSPVSSSTGRHVKTLMFSFFCPEKTRFSQDSKTCIRTEHAYPCDKAHTLYELNKAIGQVPKRSKKKTVSKSLKADTGSSIVVTRPPSSPNSINRFSSISSPATAIPKTTISKRNFQNNQADVRQVNIMGPKLNKNIQVKTSKRFEFPDPNGINNNVRTKLNRQPVHSVNGHQQTINIPNKNDRANSNQNSSKRTKEQSTFSVQPISNSAGLNFNNRATTVSHQKNNKNHFRTNGNLKHNNNLQSTGIPLRTTPIVTENIVRSPINNRLIPIGTPVIRKVKISSQSKKKTTQSNNFSPVTRAFIPTTQRSNSHRATTKRKEINHPFRDEELDEIIKKLKQFGPDLPPTSDENVSQFRHSDNHKFRSIFTTNVTPKFIIKNNKNSFSTLKQKSSEEIDDSFADEELQELLNDLKQFGPDLDINPQQFRQTTNNGFRLNSANIINEPADILMPPPPLINFVSSPKKITSRSNLLNNDRFKSNLFKSHNKQVSDSSRNKQATNRNHKEINSPSSIRTTIESNLRQNSRSHGRTRKVHVNITPIHSNIGITRAQSETTSGPNSFGVSLPFSANHFRNERRIDATVKPSTIGVNLPISTVRFSNQRSKITTTVKPRTIGVNFPISTTQFRNQQKKFTTSNPQKTGVNLPHFTTQFRDTKNIITTENPTTRGKVSVQTTVQQNSDISFSRNSIHQNNVHDSVRPVANSRGTKRFDPSSVFGNRVTSRGRISKPRVQVAQFNTRRRKTKPINSKNNSKTNFRIKNRVPVNQITPIPSASITENQNKKEIKNEIMKSPQIPIINTPRTTRTNVRVRKIIKSITPIKKNHELFTIRNDFITTNPVVTSSLIRTPNIQAIDSSTFRKSSLSNKFKVTSSNIQTVTKPLAITTTESAVIKEERSISLKAQVSDRRRLSSRRRNQRFGGKSSIQQNTEHTEPPKDILSPPKNKVRPARNRISKTRKVVNSNPVLNSLRNLNARRRRPVSTRQKVPVTTVAPQNATKVLDSTIPKNNLKSDKIVEKSTSEPKSRTIKISPRRPNVDQLLRSLRGSSTSNGNIGAALQRIASFKGAQLIRHVITKNPKSKKIILDQDIDKSTSTMPAKLTVTTKPPLIQPLAITTPKFRRISIRGRNRLRGRTPVVQTERNRAKNNAKSIIETTTKLSNIPSEIISSKDPIEKSEHKTKVNNDVRNILNANIKRSAKNDSSRSNRNSRINIISRTSGQGRRSRVRTATRKIVRKVKIVRQEVDNSNTESNTTPENTAPPNTTPINTTPAVTTESSLRIDSSIKSETSQTTHRSTIRPSINSIQRHRRRFSSSRNTIPINPPVTTTQLPETTNSPPVSSRFATLKRHTFIRERKIDSSEDNRIIDLESNKKLINNQRNTNHPISDTTSKTSANKQEYKDSKTSFSSFFDEIVSANRKNNLAIDSTIITSPVNSNTEANNINIFDLFTFPSVDKPPFHVEDINKLRGPNEIPKELNPTSRLHQINSNGNVSNRDVKSGLKLRVVGTSVKSSVSTNNNDEISSTEINISQKDSSPLSHFSDIELEAYNAFILDNKSVDNRSNRVRKRLISKRQL